MAKDDGKVVGSEADVESMEWWKGSNPVAPSLPPDTQPIKVEEAHPATRTPAPIPHPLAPAPVRPSTGFMQTTRPPTKACPRCGQCILVVDKCTGAPAMMHRHPVPTTHFSCQKCRNSWEEPS